MAPATRLTLLRIVLFATAGFLCLVLPFMFDLWPAGFRWAHPAEHPAYERMIIAIYFALGVCSFRRRSIPSVTSCSSTSRSSRASCTGRS